MTFNEMILQIDNECSYPQALEIIKALRRLEKLESSERIYTLDRYLNGKRMAVGYSCQARSLFEAIEKAIAHFGGQGYSHKPKDFIERRSEK